MKVAVIALVLVAVLGLGGYFFFTNRNSQETSDTSGTTVGTSGSPLAAPADASVAVGNTKVTTREILMEASEFKFVPNEIRVKKGETVKITMKNTGRMQHNWMVEGLGGSSIDTTSAGQTGAITITPSQKGTFTTYCSVGNHRQQGMVGKLIVE